MDARTRFVQQLEAEALDAGDDGRAWALWKAIADWWLSESGRGRGVTLEAMRVGWLEPNMHTGARWQREAYIIAAGAVAAELRTASHFEWSTYEPGWHIVLPGFVGEDRRVRGWCEACVRWHVHGWVEDERGGTTGQKVPHCDTQPEVWRSWTLMDAGDWRDGVPHDHRRWHAPIACRCDDCAAGRRRELHAKGVQVRRNGVL